MVGGAAWALPVLIALLVCAAAASAQTFSASPTSLAFGTILESTTAKYQLVTVTNTGSANLTFSAIQFTGTNAADFAFTKGFDTNRLTPGVPSENCVNNQVAVDGANGTLYLCSGSSPGTSGTWSAGGSLLTQVTNTVGSNTYPECLPGIAVAPSASCIVPVEVVPSTTSSESASLQFTDNASGSPHTVSLSVTGGSVSGTALSACQTLSTAGSYYLSANVSSTDACFPVSAANIVIMLNGHTLTYGTSPSQSGLGRAGIYSSAGYDPIIESGTCQLSTGNSYCMYGMASTSGANNLVIEGPGTIIDGCPAGNVFCMGIFEGQGHGSNWQIHDLTIQNSTVNSPSFQGIGGSGYSGEGDQIWKVTISNSSGQTTSRCQYYGDGILQGAGDAPVSASTIWENTITGGNDNGIAAPEYGSFLFGNYISVGNPNGTSAGTASSCTGIGTSANGTQAEGFAFELGPGDQTTTVNNVINNSEARGIDFGSGAPHFATAAGNFTNVIDYPNYVEYQGSQEGGEASCDPAGVYGERIKTFAYTSQDMTFSYDNITAYANQCNAYAFSISDNTSTTNTLNYLTLVSRLQSGHAAVNAIALGNDDLEDTGSGALMNGYHLYLSGDTIDYLGSNEAGPGGPFACYSCTWNEPATKTSGICGDTGHNYSLGSWVMISICFPGEWANNTVGPVYLIDPTYSGGAAFGSDDFTVCNTYCASNMTASYVQMWTYTVTVKNGSGALISGASVSATDAQSGTSNALGNAYSCTTNSQGQCSFVVNDKMKKVVTPNTPTTTSYNPISFTITAPGCTALNYGKTVASTLNDTETLAGACGTPTPVLPPLNLSLTATGLH